jgi:hypothetical protein
MGEPIFSLKTTIEYLKNEWANKQLHVTKAIQTVVTSKPFMNDLSMKHSNIYNKAESKQEIELIVEGTISKGNVYDN